MRSNGWGESWVFVNVSSSASIKASDKAPFKASFKASFGLPSRVF
jgi:hypothetical protein